MINIQWAGCTNLIMTLMSALNNISYMFILSGNGAVYNHCRHKVPQAFSILLLVVLKKKSKSLPGIEKLCKDFLHFYYRHPFRLQTIHFGGRPAQSCSCLGSHWNQRQLSARNYGQDSSQNLLFIKSCFSSIS